MKTTSLILLLIAAPLVLWAQEATTTNNYPHWTISKDVHRFTYQKTLYAPLEIKLMDISALVSKNVHRTSRIQTGFVTRNGYPAWTISKPTARQAAERSQKKSGTKD